MNDLNVFWKYFELLKVSKKKHPRASKCGLHIDRCDVETKSCVISGLLEFLISRYNYLTHPARTEWKITTLI